MGAVIGIPTDSHLVVSRATMRSEPLEFCLNMIKAGTNDDAGFRHARSIAVLEAASESYGWDPRPSPKVRRTGDILTGRGIAYSFRGQTVAQIAEVEVNRKTGHVWAKRLVLRS